MKKRIFILSALLMVSLGIVQSVQPVLAAEKSQEIEYSNRGVTEELIENPRLRGKTAPTGSSFLDLSSNTYKYSVDFKVQIYTNSLFSRVSSMNVKVNSIAVNKNGMQNKSKGITVTLYKSNGTKVASKTIGLAGGTAKFTELSKSTKYYVGFSKQNDTQSYKFSGTVKKGS